MWFSSAAVILETASENERRQPGQMFEYKKTLREMLKPLPLDMVKSKTIYLADDDADDRLLLTEAITTLDPNIEIVETENGQELLAILQSHTLPGNSLILLDMNMPKMNGLETLANLRNVPHLASIPAVMLSTSGNPEMIIFAKQLGAVNYFIKPTSMEGLLQLSRQLISDNLGQ